MEKGQINILVVDDDESSRKSLAEAVKRAGYRVTQASKPEEALNAVRIQPVHGAIIDCMLPRMNGVQLADELGKGRFGKGPIIFVSGVFRDQSFAQSAINTTNAVGYFCKPAPLHKILKLFDENFQGLIDVPKVPLHALLSKPYASDREKLKALESIENITGFDLPLIISILMGSGSTGFLNVITNDGDISGITFVEGGIIEVDMAEIDKLTENLLIKHGFVTQRDIEELPENKRRNNVLKHLIDENLISPHAGSVIKSEQVICYLRELFIDKPLQINFVPDRIRRKSNQVKAKELTPLLHEIIQKRMNLPWLEKFYSNWMDHPMRLGPEFNSSYESIELIIKNKLSGFIKELRNEPTLNEVLENSEYSKEDLLKAVHLIALCRLIIFDDIKRSKNVSEQLERLKDIEGEIKSKNPFEIFEYFGAGLNPAVKDVKRIYKEFARANHPDLLSQNASDEIRDTAHRVYVRVSNAYDILRDEVKREELIQNLKQKEAERQLLSENTVEEAMIQLKRGHAKIALEKFQESYKLHPSTTNLIYLCWAKLKSHTDNIPDELQKEIQDKLKELPHEDRSSPNYLFVNGLLKKAAGDFKGAQVQLEEILRKDPHFLDARRELSRLRHNKQNSIGNNFTGELISFVGRLFKKQAKKN